MSDAKGPITTYLVSGFLGAGKTTFIREQLKKAGARTAVLVNEFGELGVDGALIRAAGGIDVVELPGGCICCSQKDGLEQSILTIAREIAPELLLIEPSGIAESSELMKVLSAPSLAEVVRIEAAIAVVDAETFLEFSEPEAFGTFFLDQIVNADLILLNKSDLVDQEELAAIEARVEKFSPGAVVFATTFCRMEGELPTGGGKGAPATSAGGGSARMECASIVPGAVLSVDAFKAFLDAIAEGQFGSVARGKGFLRVEGEGLLCLQLVGGRVAVEPFLGGSEPRLTLIGSGLNRERLRAFFN